tara:strand:+ start:109 stop:1116 length:1008 start_codon:yes stop_codon:yes gene_type:complete
MPVYRNDGDIVPFKPYHNSNIIDSYWMDYNDFAELDEVFCQRNTEGRLSKAQKHLSKLLPEHVVVYVARLTKADTVFGRKYKAGKLWRIDSNTRALNWKRGGSDAIPEKVFVIEYSFDSIDRIRESYNTFDSPDSVERNQEKMYGILSGMYNFTPQSEKLIKGQILTGLNKASNFFYPETWNQYTIRTSELPGQVGAFLEEIKALDKIIKVSANWDQALTCAALMALKKYGCYNQKLIDGLTDIDQRACNTKGKNWDGITHIVWEWVNAKMFPDKTTNWTNQNGLNRTVSYVCYWIDKYMSDETGKQAGNNWIDTASKWKDQQVTSLNRVFAISN